MKILGWILTVVLVLGAVYLGAVALIHCVTILLA